MKKNIKNIKALIAAMAIATAIKANSKVSDERFEAKETELTETAAITVESTELRKEVLNGLRAYKLEYTSLSKKDLRDAEYEGEGFVIHVENTSKAQLNHIMVHSARRAGLGDAEGWTAMILS